jgi:hypothetical protein
MKDSHKAAGFGAASATATASVGGISFGSLLTIVFIILKLTGYITWSWVWVLAPLWIPVVGFVVFAGIVAILIALLSK